MRRPGPRTLLLLAIAALAACGDDGAGPASSAGPAATPPPSGPPRTQRAEAATDAAVGRQAVIALLEAWIAVGDDAEASRAVEAKMVAGGDAALAHLIALLGTRDDGVVELAIPWFRERAVAPLLARLATADASIRAGIVDVLGLLVPVWRDMAEGSAVARALLAELSTGQTNDVAVALGRSGAAGRVIAKDLADLWVHGDDETKRRASGVLIALGLDAGPAASAVLAAIETSPPPRRLGTADDEETDSRAVYDASERCTAAQEILSAIGPSDPSILGRLRKLLASDGFAPAATAAARVLRSWGDDAAPAVPELLAMLGSTEDDDQRTAAALALRAIRSQSDAIWRAVSEAVTRGDAWTRAPADRYALDVFATDAEFGPRLVRMLPTLPADAIDNLYDAVVSREGPPPDLSQVVPLLLRNPSPAVRLLALEAWHDGELARDTDECRMPAGAERWLDDPDVSVRAKAASVLAWCDDAPAARIGETARALLAHDDASVREDAVMALGEVAERDAAALTAVLAALDRDSDDSVRRAAMVGLSYDDVPIAGDHAGGVAWLAARVAGRLKQQGFDSDDDLFASALLRLAGGTDALAAAIVAALGESESLSNRDRVLSFAWTAAQRAGPRLAAIRPSLLHIRATLKEGECYEADWALGAISDDPDEIALTQWASDSTVRRLAGMGARGRAAIVLLAGAPRGHDVAEHLEGLGLDAEIVAASHAAAPDPLAETRRVGAARLVCTLPADQVVAVGTALLGDPSGDVRDALVSSLEPRDDETPVAAPLALLQRVLEDAEYASDGAQIAGALGRRAANLVPTLRALRDASDPKSSPYAAIALWRITHDADESLPVLRRLLATTDFFSKTPIQWRYFCEALGEMPLGKPELDAIVASLRDYETWPGVTEILVPLLERFGPDAAPAVPSLRRVVAFRIEGYQQAGGAEPAARVLGAIGAAAVPALPELRKWVADFGDRDGIGREAIRKIEAARDAARK